MTDTDPDPSPILEVADGFMASQQLFAARSIGLFETLADGPATLASLETELQIPSDRLRIVLEAMVALGIVHRRDDAYANSPEADAFLTGQGPMDLRPALRYREEISFPMWVGYPQAVAEGLDEPQHLEEDEVELFSDAMAAFTEGMAQSLAADDAWSEHRSILDVGGGKGRWLQVLLDRHANLEGTLFELPDVAEIAREQVPERLTDRLKVVAGDALEDALPEGHDAVLLANVVHQFPPDTNRSLLGRIRKAVDPGARLLIADTWIDPETSQPASAAMLGGEFFLFTGRGRSYGVDEARSWLDETGWAPIGHELLGGPVSLVVAEAR